MGPRPIADAGEGPRQVRPPPVSAASTSVWSRATEAGGSVSTARRTIQGVLQTEPQNLDAWIASWEIALAAEDGEDAGRVGLRLLDLLKRRARTNARMTTG